MHKKLNILIWGSIPFIVFLILFINSKEKVKEYQLTGSYFNEAVKISVYTKSNSKGKQAITKMEEILKTYENYANTEKEIGTNLYTLNHSNQKEVALPSGLFDFIFYGKSWYDLTNHKGNIQTHQLLSTWEKAFEENKLPSEETLQQIKIPKVEDITLKDRTIYWEDQLDLDTSFYEKGYVLKKVIDYLKTQNLLSYKIQMGSYTTVGNYVSSGFYKVALSGDTEDQIEHILALQNQSVVTLGTEKEMGTIDGVEYSKFIDPDTRKPGTIMKRVTVLSKDPLLSDTLANALYHMSVEDGKKMIQSYSQVQVIWTKPDGTTEMTPGMKRYLIK